MYIFIVFWESYVPLFYHHGQQTWKEKTRRRKEQEHRKIRNGSKLEVRRDGVGDEYFKEEVCY